MRRTIIASLALIALLAWSRDTSAASCGSVILAEKAAPAVFSNFTLSGSTVARFWQAGSASTTFSNFGCTTGCLQVGPHVAITGVNWLNASTCAGSGQLPARTVFVIENTTPSSGGVWAAFSLDKNPTNANYDLDARATGACGGCSSTTSPILGAGGQPIVMTSMIAGGNLTASLTWSAPSSAAQALSNGANILTSYAVYYKRSTNGVAPTNTGTKTGWILLQDLEADGASLGGYSTTTTASVTVPLGGSSEFVYFAVGLNFDGGGNPDADTNTRPSTYLSGASSPFAICSAPDSSAPWVQAPTPVTLTQTLCQ